MKEIVKMKEIDFDSALGLDGIQGELTPLGESFEWKRRPGHPVTTAVHVDQARNDLSRGHINKEQYNRIVGQAVRDARSETTKSHVHRNTVGRSGGGVGSNPGGSQRFRI